MQQLFPGVNSIEIEHQHASILTAFNKSRDIYEDFTNKIEMLIDTLLKADGINIEAIHTRVKTKKSLTAKLNRPGKTYSKIESIPDLAGLRILVYHPADLERVAQIVRNEFEVDNEESGDSATRLAPHEFGYLSIHLIIHLSQKRSQLPEWRHLNNLHAEVQIRTILQHAWASISHSLQYKREDEVPVALRRRLHRLSALLELADQEFDTLNQDHKLLLATRDKENASTLMVLRKALGTNAHSFDWIREHTALTMSDNEFTLLISNNSENLKMKRMIRHDENGIRIRPGKPGMKFK
jgi:ppGpp synthetase/RelA/SpoT-type nucleotidyltranferase